MGLFDHVLEPTIIYCDNQSCVKLTKNQFFYDMLKHIDIKCHFICDMVQKGAMMLQYVSIDEQNVDIMTKPLSRAKFVYLTDKLLLIENSSLIGREC